jgi:hypothetical protein
MTNPDGSIDTVFCVSVRIPTEEAIESVKAALKVLHAAGTPILKLGRDLLILAPELDPEAPKRYVFYLHQNVKPGEILEKARNMFPELEINEKPLGG